MSNSNEPNDALDFDLPKNPPAVIKVIGVGGGGGNAVNHMQTLGVRGVDFFVCNTDAQALLSSNVPNRIQLGANLTEGLGAGANPEVGRQAAEESANEIMQILENNTKMVFVTAGMGGGTGTGAAPVIARLAKEAGILTVGIVTTPFQFEGGSRLKQAELGIEEMRRNVDSLIVINNNKLREVYGNLGFKAGFSKADEVVAIAVRGIAEVITHQYNINIDLRDAKTVLNNSGTAIMGSGKATGENRAKEAIMRALDSPLLNDNHIRGAKNVLLLIVSGQEEITIDEIGEINDHIQQQAGGSADIIMGIGEEENLGNEIAVTVVATGFSTEKQDIVHVQKAKRIVHTLDEDQAVSQNIFEKSLEAPNEEDHQVTTSTSEAEETKSTPQIDLFSTADPLPKSKSNIEVEENKDVDNEIEAESKDDDKDNDVIMTFHLDDDDDHIPFSIEDVEDSEKEEEVEESAPVMEEEVTLEEAPKITLAMEEEKYIYETSPDIEESCEPKMADADENEIKEEVKAETQTEEEKTETIRYNLDDYMELENELKRSTPPTKENTVPAAPTQNEKSDDVDMHVRTEEAPKTPPVQRKETESDPFDAPISSSMQRKNEERRNQLKAFNHRFKNVNQYVDELSTVPAYKRQGLELNEERPSKSEGFSRFSVSEDEEKGPSLRGNNSFLHDNVD